MTDPDSRSERNKQLVIRFYNALVQADLPTIRALGRADYVQHNPAIPTGLQAVIDWFSSRPRPAVTPPPLQFVRVLADGDYVLTVRRLEGVRPGSTEPPGPDSECAIIDLWRVQDGEVAEHADYIEQFPRGGDAPKNANGRFF